MGGKYLALAFGARGGDEKKWFGSYKTDEACCKDYKDLSPYRCWDIFSHKWYESLKKMLVSIGFDSGANLQPCVKKTWEMGTVGS